MHVYKGFRWVPALLLLLLLLFTSTVRDCEFTRTNPVYDNTGKNIFS